MAVPLAQGTGSGRDMNVSYVSRPYKGEGVGEQKVNV